MREWKKTVENCFFTDRLDECLKGFLDGQKVSTDDKERWEFLFKNAYVWKRSCSADFDQMMMPSFFGQWNICAFWGEFSFPEHISYTPEETLYWIFLTGWILTEDYGRGERTADFPGGNLDRRLREQFRYPQETCAWLDKRQQNCTKLEQVYLKTIPKEMPLLGFYPCSGSGSCIYESVLLL